MKKMCALNEDLFRKSNLDVPEGPVKVDGATNPVYTDALNQHAKRKKDIEKIMKDADKVDELEEPFTGSTDKKNMPKKVNESKTLTEAVNSGSLYKVFIDGEDEYLITEKFSDIKKYLEDYAKSNKDFKASIKKLGGFEFKTPRWIEYDGGMYNNLTYPDQESKVVVFSDGVCKTDLNEKDFPTPSRSHISDYLVRLNNDVKDFGKGKIVSPKKESHKFETTISDILHLFDSKEEADEYTKSGKRKNESVTSSKLSLQESLFEDSDNDLDSDQYIASRYLDIEIPDICQDTLDKIENMTAQQVKVIASKCRDFYAFLEGKISGMNEAYAYDGADQMGRAQCSPLVPDFSGSIKDYVKHYGEDEKYDSIIMSSLKDIVVKLLDSKQEVENFNAYWSERYPLLIDYIDNQIALIPFDVLNYGDGRVEEELHEEADAYEIGEIVYKRKRQPLADIIQDELTSGEWVYKYNGKALNPTPAPSLNIDPEEIGVDSDNKGDFVIAWVETEDDTKEVEDVAKKYGKEFISGYDRYVRGKNKFFTKIYLNEEEWDEPYFDPNVRTK
jgi:hypothetical protein